MYKLIFSFFTIFLFAFSMSGQDIPFTNPSFEDRPHVGMNNGVGPRGWYDCGQSGETAPDIQPSPNDDEPFFDVVTEAYDGNTYVGMVVRDNDTWESIGQRLRTPMKKGVTYHFSIYLAMSEYYTSLSRKTKEPIDYITPATLRIWGGDDRCSKKELLGKTERISHTDWEEYIFELTASSDHTYLILEAYWKVPVMFAYNGNLLLDNCSGLVRMDGLSEAQLEELDAKKAKIKEQKESGIVQQVTKKDKGQSTAVIAAVAPVAFLDTVALTPTFVKTQINKCKSNNINADEFGFRLMKIEFLTRVYALEEMSKSGGIKKYLETQPAKELGLCVRAAKKLGASNTLTLLTELKRIQSKKDEETALEASETTFLNNLEKELSAAAKKDAISDLIQKYIGINEVPIRREMGFCESGK